MKDILPPTPEEFDQERVRIWQRFSPRIYACKKCGHAVASGYCCNTCGDPNPSEPKENDVTAQSIRPQTE